MALESTVDSLLERWQALRTQGREASAEDLCRDHPELLEQVRQAIHERADRPLDVTDAWSGGPTASDILDESSLDALPPDKPPEVSEELWPFLSPPQGPEELGRLGPYRVVKLLGAGGMGAVFQAVDTQLGRSVALKTLRPTLADNAVARKRFLREARAAAAVEHDHVVPIFHVGEDNGTPYLVMPFLHGQALDDRLKEGTPLTTTEIMRIGREIAEGLAAAHEHGLIHRDIKPGNIWLEGPKKRVKILDFGLAHTAEEADVHLTQSGAVLGTPAYMSPEQASNEPVDHRSDLFSLGVVLYRMATGRTPFTGKSAALVLASVVRDDPPPPRLLNPDLPEPLSNLVRKLLSKDPSRRPPTARAVVDALDAIDRARPAVILPGLEVEPPPTLQDMPPVPRPKPLPLPSKRAVACFALALGLLGLAAYFVGPQLVRVLTDKGELVIETDDPDVQVMVKQNGNMVVIVDETTGHKVELKSGSYDVKLFRAPDTLTLSTSQFTLRRGEKEVVKVSLKPKIARTAPPLPREEVTTVPAKIPVVQLAPDWPQGEAVEHFSGLVPTPTNISGLARWQIKTRASQAHLNAVAWSPDGTQVASGSNDGAVRVYDFKTLKLARIWPIPNAPASLAWSPDGKRIVTGDWNGSMRVWDVSEGTAGLELRGHTSNVRSIAFSPDGKRIASAGSWDKTVRFWDANDGSPGLVLNNPHRVDSVAWGPDGKRVASGCADKVVRVWDASTGEVTMTLEGHTADVRTVAFSPDGQYVVSGGGDGTVRTWDAATGKAQRVFQADQSGPSVMAVAVNKDGRIASGGGDYRVHLWDLNSDEPGPVCAGHDFHVVAVSLSADGLHVASVSEDGSLRFWDARSGRAEGVIVRETMRVDSLSFSPDGLGLASSGTGSTVRLWNVGDGTPGFLFKGHTSSSVLVVAFSPDGRQVASGGSDGDYSVRLWNAHEGTPGPVMRGHTGPVRAVAFGSDGRLLASVGMDKALRLWEKASGLPFHTIECRDGDPWCLSFSHDGGRIAVGFWEGPIRFYDTSTGKPGAVLTGQEAGLRCLAFSPDGRRLVSGQERWMRIWDSSNGVLESKIDTKHSINSLDFNSDGLSIAIGSWYSPAQLWEVGASEPKRTFPGQSGICSTVRMSPDRRLLASGSTDGTIRLWDVTTGAPVRVIVPLSGDRSATISAAGRLEVSEPSAEDEFVYLIQEKAGGPVDSLTPAAFRARFGPALPKSP